MFHDVVPPFAGVGAHVEIQQLAYLMDVFDTHRNGPHLFADELPEFFRGNFAESLETGDFEVFPFFQLLEGGFLLRVTVAVKGFFLVADPEKRSFQDIEMPADTSGS